ncbi:MAG: hypothetical protein HYS08_06550 [Chlamydiae bacterium]|nr:hypothetical protein [Chlamydiota bacterium]MBI3265578.1 hypothetical protein [Chlamydiota bacterium]
MKSSHLPSQKLDGGKDTSIGTVLQKKPWVPPTLEKIELHSTGSGTMSLPVDGGVYPNDANS